MKKKDLQNEHLETLLEEYGTPIKLIRKGVLPRYLLTLWETNDGKGTRRVRLPLTILGIIVCAALAVFLSEGVMKWWNSGVHSKSTTTWMEALSTAVFVVFAGEAMDIGRRYRKWIGRFNTHICAVLLPILITTSSPSTFLTMQEVYTLSWIAGLCITHWRLSNEVV